MIMRRGREFTVQMKTLWHEFEVPIQGVGNMSTVYAPVPGKVEDVLMDEDEFKQMLGISAQNAESIWGHQKIDETLNSSDETIDDKTFNEVIKTIDFDDLLETMSDDSPSQSNIIPNIEDSTSKLRTDFSNTDMLMSQRDPMISHGSMTITGGADLKITTTPVLLEQRICQDSTYNKGKFFNVLKQLYL